MNADLRKKSKNDIEKDFFKLMNNADSGKAMEIVTKHRGIKFVKKKELFSIRTKLSYNNFFFWKLLAMYMKKSQINMSKSVYLGMSIRELSKLVMYQFWYDYVKPKYGKESKHKNTLHIHCIHKNK